MKTSGAWPSRRVWLWWGFHVFFADAAVAVEPLNIDDFAAMSVEQAVAWIKTAARLGEHEAVALRNKRCSGRHLLELEAQDYTALGLDDVSGLLIYRVVEKWRAAHSATPLVS